MCGFIDCCQSIVVPGGTFSMGCTTASDPDCGADSPAHKVTVSSFALDTFEVTVGRFRKFVTAFNGTEPPVGAGANPNAPTGTVTGWTKANSTLPASPGDLITSLKCYPGEATWTDSATGGNESYAINCVDWATAFAFCVWDGGRLPTEAEWEYVAAGGGTNRPYPWGSADPSLAVGQGLANYYYSGGNPLIAVGSRPSGNAAWGHADLAGGMWEWVFDTYDSGWYTGGGAVCSNCSNTTGSDRLSRGGSWSNRANVLRAAYRYASTPSSRSSHIGFRCARTP